VATAALSDRNDLLQSSGIVRVAVAPVDGVPPLPGSIATDCEPPDDGSVRTTAVDVTFAHTTHMAQVALAASVTLTAADVGAPAAGSAVVVESSAPGTRCCRDGSTTPTVDGFSTCGFELPITTYVVAPAADLVLRVTGLRNEAGSNASGPWDRVTVWAGACPDAPAALCAPPG